MLSSLFGGWWSAPDAPAPDQPVIRHSFSKDKPSKKQDPKAVPHVDQSFPVQKLQKQQTRIEKLLAINQERRNLEASTNARSLSQTRFGAPETAAPTPQNQQFVQACLSVLDERNNDPDTVHPSDAPIIQASQLSAEDLKQLRTDKSTTTGKQDLLRAHLKHSTGKISPQSGPSPTAASMATVSLPPHPSALAGSRSNNTIAAAAASAAKAATADRRPSLPRANSRSPASSESNIITSKPKQPVVQPAKQINILYNPKNLTAQENYDLTPVPYQYQSPYIADSPATANAAPLQLAAAAERAPEDIDPEKFDAELDPSVSADNPITLPASPSRGPARARQLPSAVANGPQGRGGDVLNVHSLTMREMLYNPKFVGNENYDLTPIPFPHLAHHT